MLKRSPVTLAIAMLGFGVFGGWGCSAGNNSNPGRPSPVSRAVVTIDIISIAGSRSFSPNPATLAPGQMVVWRNLDSETHRVGFDDRSVDTGNIASGESSIPMPIELPGPYHCRRHPMMIGAFK